jgi:hypothetical protein
MDQTLLNNLESELPALIGDTGWRSEGGQITQLIHDLRQTADDKTQEMLLYQLVSVLEIFPSAFRAWKYESNIRSWRDIYDEATFKRDVSAILPANLVNEALEQSYNAAALVFMPGEVHRRISRTPGGESKSIKFSNFRIDLGAMTEIVAGAVTAGYDAIKDPHPLVIAAGLLLTVRALLKAITVEISEQEASVFWSFVQACDEQKTAAEDAIFAKTNLERERLGLQPLTDLAFKGSLEKLKYLKATESIGDKRWRIIENYNIPD